MTTLIAGFAEEFTEDEVGDMVERARQLLAGIPPITVTLGRILYHPEAIVFALRPGAALDPVFKAVRAATHLAATGEETARSQAWTPHVTVAYSTSVQPAGPIIAALGRELPSCQVTISRIDLVVQEGSERLWNWRSIAEVPFRGLIQSITSHEDGAVMKRSVAVRPPASLHAPASGGVHDLLLAHHIGEVHSWLAERF